MRQAITSFMALFLWSFTSSPALAAPPIGAMDVSTSTRSAGWARDPDNSGSVPMHLYIDDVLYDTQTANLPHADQGNHGFDFQFSPLGTGSHMVKAFAIDVLANGQPDPNGTNIAVGGQKTITANCNEIINGGVRAWCTNNPNYWLERQSVTKILRNKSVMVGINNSYGGFLTQLYNHDRSKNLIHEHGGSGVQISIWGYDASGAAGGWFTQQPGTCDTTVYTSEGACLQNASQCRYYGWAKKANGSPAAHLVDCNSVYDCVGWGAGAPWNPLQAQAANCGWHSPTNDVVIKEAVGNNTWHTLHKNPYHFTKSNNFLGMDIDQVVTLFDTYAKVDYTVTYDGPYTTPHHGQEFPAFFTGNNVNHWYYWYEGNEPFVNADSGVTEEALPLSDKQKVAFENFPNPSADPNVVGLAKERWWGVCSQDKEHCITLATYSPLIWSGFVRKGSHGGTNTGEAVLTAQSSFNFHPGMKRETTLYVFPYRWDEVVDGKSIRQRIFEIAAAEGYNPNPTEPPTDIEGDIDGDGGVDMDDYNLVVNQFGSTYDIFDLSLVAGNFGG